MIKKTLDTLILVYTTIYTTIFKSARALHRTNTVLELDSLLLLGGVVLTCISMTYESERQIH
jgi:hypothetical protein